MCDLKWCLTWRLYLWSHYCVRFFASMKYAIADLPKNANVNILFYIGIIALQTREMTWFENDIFCILY